MDDKKRNNIYVCVGREREKLRVEAKEDKEKR